MQSRRNEGRCFIMSGKTADYTRRAIDNYNAKKDRFTVITELGTKDRIKAVHNGSINEYIINALYNQLEKDEKHQNKSE